MKNDKWKICFVFFPPMNSHDGRDRQECLSYLVMPLSLMNGLMAVITYLRSRPRDRRGPACHSHSVGLWCGTKPGSWCSRRSSKSLRRKSSPAKGIESSATVGFSQALQRARPAPQSSPVFRKDRADRFLRAWSVKVRRSARSSLAQYSDSFSKITPRSLTMQLLKKFRVQPSGCRSVKSLKLKLVL